MVEAPEVPHHHHHKTGLPWFDLIVPLAVLCISIASLLTSLQSEKSMHALVEQNTRLVEAQSTPLLMLDSANLDDQGRAAISLVLSNVGTGPAQIAWFRVHDDQGNDMTGHGLSERLHGLDPSVGFLSQVVGGSFLRSGDQRLVFRVPRPKDGSPAVAEFDRLNTARFHLDASACYCSMFEECRVTHFNEKQPVKVASCDEAGKG